MKKRRFFSCMLALLLAASLPVSALADTYDLAQGSVTVTATESGQTVTQENNPDRQNFADSNPIITGTATENTVTIKAEENATANVTLQDVNIVISDDIDGQDKAAVTVEVAENAASNVTLSGVDIDLSATGNISEWSGEAAIQIKGSGDVTLELDGENTAHSGEWRAGVEKDDANSTGNLTITDNNETDGSLTVTGGSLAAGIGGGHNGGGFGVSGTLSGNASNITISGSAEVTATGGNMASGIGGGNGGDGSDITITDSAKVTAKSSYDGSGIGGGGVGDGSDITIGGSAKVTAEGGGNASGIGGGAHGDGSHITITGSAEVTAAGGNMGSGIGGGRDGSGSNITISQDAQVKVQGGAAYTADDAGAGAAIGEGGKWIIDGEDNTFIAGEELAPDTSKLTPNGRIEYYTPGEDMGTADPYNTVIGTYVLPQPTEPVQPSQPEEAPAQPLYRVNGQDGKTLACQEARKDGVLTITVDADYAAFTGSLSGIQILKTRGVDTIVFVTKGASSTFALSDLLAQGSWGDTYALTHDGSTVSFTLGQDADIGKILK